MEARHAVAGFVYGSSTETVSVGYAVYYGVNYLLRVQATDSIKASVRGAPVLHVYETATAAFIGNLQGNPDGTYSGDLSWPSNPQVITVKSSEGAHADKVVVLGRD